MTLLPVLETALDAVIVMRIDGTVAEWNGEAARIFGWSREEVLDRMLAEIIVPSRHRQAHIDGLSHYLATGTGPVLRQRIEITGLTRKGTEVPIELSITPIGTPGELLFLAFVRDISGSRAAFAAVERKALEASLLHRIASHAAESVSLDESITLALEVICELLDWPVGHAFLARPDSETLQSHLWVGDLSTFAALVDATRRVRFLRGTGLPGRVWATQNPQWVEKIDGEVLFVRGTGAELGILAAFAIPIVSDGHVVAVLEFFSPFSHSADPDLILIARTVGEQVGRALERQEARDRQTLVLGELEHRTKNMLAVVASMAAQTARSALTVDDYQSRFAARLASLASAYGLLTQANWEETSLRALIREVVGPHLATGSAQLQLTGVDVLTSPKMALGLSMVLHELTTNAVKYGALSTAMGMISVEVSITTGDPEPLVEIRWVETGLEACSAPSKAGFGTRLMERVTRQDLGGTLAVDFPASGVAYRLRFPAPT